MLRFDKPTEELLDLDGAVQWVKVQRGNPVRDSDTDAPCVLLTFPNPPETVMLPLDLLRLWLGQDDAPSESDG